MFYKVGLAHTHLCHIVCQFGHYVKLVEAWEYQPLGILYYVRNFLLGLRLVIIKEDVVHDDVRHGVFLQNLLP